MFATIPTDERALVAYLIAGPGNRMKVLISAHRIAKLTSRKLYFAWHPQMYWCSYEGEHSGPWQQMPYKYQKHHAGKIPEISPAEAYSYHWLATEPRVRWIDEVIRPEEDDQRVIVVSGWKYLRFPGEPILDFIGDRGNPWSAEAVALLQVIEQEGRGCYQLSEELRGRADIELLAESPSFTSAGTRSIGLQVRYEHDYCHKIPEDLFLSAALAECTKAVEDGYIPSVFVTSDNEARELSIARKILGSGFHAFTRCRGGLGLWERIAAGEGLIDLDFLSRCDKVIGTKGSSFSELAWLQGNRQLGGISWVDL